MAAPAATLLLLSAIEAASIQPVASKQTFVASQPASVRLAQPSTLDWLRSGLRLGEARETANGLEALEETAEGKMRQSPKSASRKRESRRARYSARGRSIPELSMVGDTPVEVDAALLRWLDAWGVVDVVGGGVSAQSWADVQNGKARRHPNLRDIYETFAPHSNVNIYVMVAISMRCFQLTMFSPRHSKKFCERLSAHVTWRGGRS